MDKLKKATFAGGCFWCMQPPFGTIDGVSGVIAGYAGGTKENPTYEEVSTGTTGHREAVQVTYDPEKVTYDRLLEVFWSQIDPTDPAGQFADKGSQYRTAIFYHDDSQKRAAEESKKKLEASGKFTAPVTTAILPFSNFYPAEDYHQDYAKKNPAAYGQYKRLSGREAFISRVWGTPHTVKLYSTPRCHNCNEIKEFLHARSVEFEEIDLASDDRARQYIIEETGRLTAPIVRIGDEFIFGYDPKKMDALLAKK